MKKYYYLSVVAIIALVAVMPLAVRAEEGSDHTLPPPPPTTGAVQPGQQLPPKGAPVPAMLREQLRGKAENIQNNVEVRNKLLRMGSSTKPFPPIATSTRLERKEIRDDRREDVKEARREGREDMRNATNTEDRREARKDMRKDVFEIRKQALIKQLTVSINNLKQIRERVSSRIEKAAAAGRDMTNAKTALVTADAKIQTAITALDAFKNLVPPTATSTATSTDPGVDLGKPRQVGDTAIKAVKAAHEALVAVVRAIAHAMGLGDSATTTPSTTGTGDTSTTTATTTTP